MGHWVPFPIYTQTKATGIQQDMSSCQESIFVRNHQLMSHWKNKKNRIALIRMRVVLTLGKKLEVPVTSWNCLWGLHWAFSIFTEHILLLRTLKTAQGYQDTVLRGWRCIYKVLGMQAQGPQLMPITHVQTLGMMVCAYNPSAGEGDTRADLMITGQAS